MFYGSLVFIGTEVALDGVAGLIDKELIVTPNVLEYDGPIDANYDPAGALYTVEFGTDQWIDIFQLRDTIAEHNINVEIIHALTDSFTYIEVISTNGEFDVVEDTDDTVLTDLAEQYNLDFNQVPESQVEQSLIDDDEMDEEQELDDYDDWN